MNGKTSTYLVTLTQERLVEFRFETIVVAADTNLARKIAEAQLDERIEKLKSMPGFGAIGSKIGVPQEQRPAMTEAEILAECERVFQRTGARIVVGREAIVYGSYAIFPFNMCSGVKAIALSKDYEDVYQRRKFGSEYRFVKIKAAKK